MRVRRLRNRRDQASARGRLPKSGLGAALSVAVVLGGCSSVPDEVNPVEWYRGATAWVTGDEAAPEAGDAEVVAVSNDEDVPFPNLASVPERPEPTPDPGAVEEMVASLEADRAEARAADAELRAEPVAQAPATIQAAEPGQEIPLPTPTPSGETSDARRFPPLELPDLRSALGDTETARTGRFTDTEGTSPASPGQAAGPAPRAPAAGTMPQRRPDPSPASAAGPARELASVRDVSPRPPVQPPEPFSTGRRSFASAIAGASGPRPEPAANRVAPRPPIQPPRPYSAPRSSVSLPASERAVPQTSLAALPE